MDFTDYIIIIPFASFICYCVLFVILLGSGKNKVTIHYSYYIIAMIIWSFGSFIMRTNLYPGPLFWNRILCTGLIAVPIIFYHFTLVFTDTAYQKRKLYFGYAFTSVLIICNYLGYIIKEVYIQDNVLYYKLGFMASIMALWGLCYLLLALYNIYYKVKSNVIPFFRVKYIIFGLIIIILGGLSNLIPSLGKYPFDIASNTVNAFFIIYSIYRYKFLKIKLIVRKGIAYSLYTLILTGLYILAIYIVQAALSSITGYKTITSALVMAVLLAIAFQPVKNLIQNWIDRLFYKDRLNYQMLLRDFSKVVNNVLNLDEIGNSLVQSLEKVLKPKNISLLLREGKEEYCLFYSLKQHPSENDIKYETSHPIIQYFLQGKPLLTIREIESSLYFTSMWSTEKEQLHNSEVELIIPIKLRDQLIGLLLLSEKKSEQSYSRDEIDLIFTLLNNAAVVIENARMYEDVKQQAITDGLTKLYNHRHFQDVLKVYVSRLDQVFSIAMIDIDYFKIYNDLYGHSLGDKALVKMAEVLRKSLRSGDVVARYGGDEFAMLLQNIEGDDALKVMDTIRKSIESSFFSINETNELLSISVGVACFPRHAQSAEEILKCADIAMYEAKKSGKNQCMLFASQDELSAATAESSDMLRVQDNIKSAYISAIYALAATIDARDHYTYGHSENVCRYAVALATAAGMDEKKIDIIKNAGLLHDIGKIGVPEKILTKTTTLTPDEFELMKKHVDASITIIKHVPNLIKMIPAIMSHHERYDGKGYPRGIKGENIPIEGRCLCIVDAFDAMISDRPYRKALKPDQAICELRENSGTQFDPKLTEIFIKMYQEGNLIVD